MLFPDLPRFLFVSPRIPLVFSFLFREFIDSNRGTLDVVLFPPSPDRPRGPTVFFFFFALSSLLHRGSVTCLLSSRKLASRNSRRIPRTPDLDSGTGRSSPPWRSPRLRGAAAQKPRRRSSTPWSTGSTTSSCGSSASSSTCSSARCTPAARGRSPSRAPCSSSRRRTPTR